MKDIGLQQHYEQIYSLQAMCNKTRSDLALTLKVQSTKTFCFCEAKTLSAIYKHICTDEEYGNVMNNLN